MQLPGELRLLVGNQFIGKQGEHPANYYRGECELEALFVRHISWATFGPAARPTSNDVSTIIASTTGDR